MMAEVNLNPPETIRTSSESANRGVLNRLTRAISNAVELDIVTVICDFQVENFDDPTKQTRTKLVDRPSGFVTSINLLTGDIRNAVSPQYADASGDKLAVFHQQQVELGRSIVSDNLRAIGELAEKVRAWVKEDEAKTESQT